MQAIGKILRCGFLFWVLTIFFCPFANARSADEVILWNIQPVKGASAADAQLITSIIATEISKWGKQVLTQHDINKLMEVEQTRQECGSDTSCMAEIGNALGIREIFFGSIGKLGSTWVLSLQRLDAFKVKPIARSSRTAKGSIDAILEFIPAMVKELFPERKLAEKSQEKSAFSAKKTEEKSAKNSTKNATNTGKKKQKIAQKTRQNNGDLYAKNASETAVKAQAEEVKYPMNPYKKWGHICFWSGLGIAALGGSMTALAYLSKQDADSAKTSKDLEDARKKSDVYNALAITGYAVGGALLATGITLWIISPTDKEWAEKHAISAVVSPHFWGVNVSVFW